MTVKYRESIVRTEVGPLNLAVYKFTDVAAHVLSLVSGISEKDIAKIEIINSYGTYVPSYNPSKGGGGITIPSKSDHGGEYQIRFTDNFFSDDWSDKNHYVKTDEK